MLWSEASSSKRDINSVNLYTVSEAPSIYIYKMKKKRTNVPYFFPSVSGDMMLMLESLKDCYLSGLKENSSWIVRWETEKE